MTSHDDPIDALDLHAAADGRLDRARRERVERYLADSPDDAARVAAWRRQNEVIARAYDLVLNEPVPPRLTAILAIEPSPFWRPFARAAAVAGLVVCAGFGGWVLGRGMEPEFDSRAFMERGLDGFFADGAAVPSAVAPSGTLAGPGGGLGPAALVADGPIGWKSDGLSLRLAAPDLSAQGYHVVEQRRLVMDGREVVRILYAGPDAKEVALFLRPRWRDDAAEVGWGRTRGMSFAYWLDGPLVYGVAGPIGRKALTALVDHIRSAPTETALAAPRLEADAGSVPSAALPATSLPTVPVPAMRTN